MKKVIYGVIVLVLVAVAGALGATYISSTKSQEIITAQIDGYNASANGTVFPVSLDEYQRGLFNSSARISMKFGPDISIHLRHSLKHLPWGGEIVTSVDLDAYKPEDIKEVSAIVPLEKISALTRVGVDGSSRTVLSFPDVEIKEENLSLMFKGISGEFESNAAMSKMSSDVGIKTISIGDDNGHVTLGNVSSRSSMTEQQGLALGSADLRAGSVVVRKGDENLFSLTDLSCQIKTGMSGGDVFGRTTLLFAALEAAGQKLEQGHLTLHLSGVDAEVLKDLVTLSQKIQAATLGGNDPDPEAFGEMFSLLGKLVNDNLKLTVEGVGLEADDGTVTGNGFVKLAGMDSNSMPIPQRENFEGNFQLKIEQAAFLAGFRLFMSAQSPDADFPAEVIVEQAKGMAQMFADQGLVVIDDAGDLSASFDMKAGAAMLNGQPLPM